MLFGQSPTPAVARGSSYPDEQGLPYAGGGPYAGRAVPPGTRHGPSGRETFSVRAPWEIISDKLIVYRFDFLLRRGARDFSASEPGLPVTIYIVRALAEIGQNNSRCLTNILLQQSRGAARHSKAGVGSATGGNCPYAAEAVPPGTRYWPGGREKRTKTTPAKRPVSVPLGTLPGAT